MRNFWLERKETKKKSEENPVCMWDFNTALGETIREKYESLYVKVVEVSDVCTRRAAEPACNKRWKRMEFLSNYGSFILKDIAHAGSWEFTEEFNKEVEKEYPKIYGFKTPEKHAFIFTDGDPAAPMHQPVEENKVLPPWNTETYNGWECDL